MIGKNQKGPVHSKFGRESPQISLYGGFGQHFPPGFRLWGVSLVGLGDFSGRGAHFPGMVRITCDDTCVKMRVKSNSP